MQKIVIDTNVVVSSIIQKSYPYRIVYELFVDDKFEWCISNQLMTEYYEVLSRPKFAKFQDFFHRAESLLADIERKSQKYDTTIKLEIISDINDNMILELADACLADFVITGNTTDFTFSSYKETKIVTPKEYWENYQPLD
jgi:uncharacterized protein